MISKDQETIISGLLHKMNDGNFEEIDDELNRVIMQIYGFSEEEIDAVYSWT